MRHSLQGRGCCPHTFLTRFRAVSGGCRLQSMRCALASVPCSVVIPRTPVLPASPLSWGMTGRGPYGSPLPRLRPAQLVTFARYLAGTSVELPSGNSTVHMAVSSGSPYFAETAAVSMRQRATTSPRHAVAEAEGLSRFSVTVAPQVSSSVIWLHHSSLRSRKSPP